ncbi:MAG: hypothetical protein LBS91_06020 [Clostridiales Family XIII bacterium]|nr:hypothetical protein [Clostridiales Family XIII bacterium]
MAVEGFRVAGPEQIRDAAAVKAGQVDVQGVFEYLRAKRAVRARKDADVRRQKVVGFHEAQRDETVEPRIGDFFDKGLIAHARDCAEELGALAAFGFGERLPVDGGRVRRRGASRRDAVLPSALPHAVDQLAPRPDCVFLNCVFVHCDIPLLYRHCERSAAIRHALDCFVAALAMAAFS